MKIASIYNDVEDVRMDIMWDEETKQITYRNTDTGEELSADESADTLQKAIDDTYSRYRYSWDLEFVEF